MSPKTDNAAESAVLLSKSEKKSVKADVVEKDVEAIFTPQLIPPLILLGGYIYLLRYLTVTLENEKDSDPFKRIWLSGPLFFSLLYIVVINFGVQFMKNRESFKIKPYIFTYNLYQCLFNVWSVYSMCHEVASNPWLQKVWGNTPQPGPLGFRISYIVWLHYNNKFFELLDTLWMILRKKNNQITFLHCYHHVLMMWAWFYCIRVESGGDCYFGATVNSAIHVIMYGYYTLALLNIPCPWKKMITNAQMIQFATVLMHSIYVVIKGNMPIELPLAQAFVMVNMLILFGNFYAKNYLSKKPSKKIE